MQHTGLQVAAPAQAAFDVEQAAEVAADDGVGAGSAGVAALVVGQLCRHFAELEREGAAEATAGFSFIHLGERDTRQQCQQGARLRLHIQLAQAGTGIVIGDLAGEVARHAVELEHREEKVCQLIRARGEALDALQRGGVVAKQLRVVGAHHAAAGAGGGDDVVEALELVEHLARQCDGRGAVARVVGRLAAASLCLRHIDRAAAVLEQADRREGDAGFHEVGEAGDEEGDAQTNLLKWSV